RPVGPLERAARWARRRPAAVGLLAAGLLLLVGMTGAAAWYVSDRFELRHRGRQVNREVNAALDQAEGHLKDLRARLEDPLRGRALLSDIDRWRSLVDQAGQDLQRARSACVGNEALVAGPTRARLRAASATLSREEADYRLARELDDIATAAVTSEDG